MSTVREDNIENNFEVYWPFIETEIVIMRLLLLLIAVWAVNVLTVPARAAQQADDAYRAGASAITSKDYLAAIDQLRQAVALDPSQEDYVTKLAEAFRRAGQFADAQLLLEKKLKSLQQPEQQRELQIALADVHIWWGGSLYQQYQYEEAVRHYQAAFAIDQALRRRNAGVDLNYMGLACQSLSRYEEGLKYYEQALPICREVKDRDGEATTLYNIGLAYDNLSRYEEGLKYYGQALPIYREVKDRDGEANTLNNIGMAHQSLSQYEEGLKCFEQALPIYREVKDRSGEATTLNNIGLAYQSLSRNEKWLEYFEQALPIYREVKDRNHEANTLNNIGLAYDKLSRYEEALKYFEQVLPIYREVKDRNHEANTLNKMGEAHRSLSRYEEALKYFEQALPIYREVKDRNGEATTLLNIGVAYRSLSQYEEALKYFEQALPIYREVKDRDGEAGALDDIGSSYQSLSHYEEALKCYEEALQIHREVKDRNGEATVLNNIGSAYQSLSHYEEALKHFEQALPIYREVKDRDGEAAMLNNIGLANDNLSRHEEALKYYGQALPICREVKDRNGEAAMLNNIGYSYQSLSHYEEGLKYYEQALPIYREVKDRHGEAGALSSIGLAYQSLSHYKEALKYYGQALPIYREVKDRHGEAGALDNLMVIWKSQGKPRLAIFYGKQSVNAYQEIRGNIRGLAKDIQKGFLTSHQDTYRRLADLLIEQGRLPEAEQVLNLLKQDEFFEFVRRDEKEAGTTTSIATTPTETKFIDQDAAFAAREATLGLRWREFERKTKATRTAEEEAEYQKIDTDRTQLATEYNAFLEKLQAELGQARKEEVRQVAEAEGLQQTLLDLRDAGAGESAVLYTLVGEKTYHVILFTPETILHFETNITAAALNKEVEAFRAVLGDPHRDPRPLAQELYRVLLCNGAVDAALQAAKTHTVMWSLDGTLRYLPMAALHDGKGYLVERYSQVLITPASLPRLLKPPQANWEGLGLGVSQAHEVTLNTGVGHVEQLHFDPLNAVPGELRGVIHDGLLSPLGVVPGTILLDSQFTETALREALENRHALVHIASHFSFRPGDENASFLLLGDGQQLTVAQLSTRRNLFDNVDLLTLSACDTAMGGAVEDEQGQGAGKEVDSFGELAQRKGAAAVVATLWPVADESTASLMQGFYKQCLARPASGKAEALRQAQLSLLRGEVKPTVSGSPGRGLQPVTESIPGLPPFTPDPNTPYTHPYYWAPFILIGNWR